MGALLLVDLPTVPERTLGLIEGIFITAAATEPMRSLGQVEAHEGRGLAGDRYAEGAGTYSRFPGPGRQLTLIDAAALEALDRDYGIRLAPGASRRNLVTRGVPLMELVGKTFWAGDALCEGVRECAPCMHLEGLTRGGVRRALEGRGGLRADIRRGGTIRVGDSVRLAVEERA